jgi:hypothetical protein
MAETKWNGIQGLVLAALCLSAHAVVLAQSSPADSLPSNFVQIQSPQSGSIAGRLTDLHSAPLARVSIVLRNQATGAEVRTTTAKNGVFRFASLDAGEYALDADSGPLGHGRIEGILVTGGSQSHVQAAIQFEPAMLTRAAAPALLEAAAPPLTPGSPNAPPSMPPGAILSAASVPPTPLPSPFPSPATVAPNSPPAVSRPAPELASVPAPATSSPQPVVPQPVASQLVASIAPIAEEPLSRFPLRISTGADANKPSAQPTANTPNQPQSVLRPIPAPQAAPLAATPPAAPPPFAPPPAAPTKPSIIAVPPATPAPLAQGRAEPQAHVLALPMRAALETQSAVVELALSVAPPRVFPLKSGPAPSLVAAVPPSLLPAALPAPVAATVAAAQPSDPVTPVVSTTVTATQLQALPASGRRWQQFLLDTPAANVSADSSQASYRDSQQSAEVTIDGANTSLAFGVAAGSISSGEAGDPQRSMSQSGGQFSTGGRSLGVSEAAIREVTAAAGNVEAEGTRSAGGRTSIRTQSGANAFHGQGSLFDRQNTWGARNPFTQWVTQTADFAPLAPFNTTALFPLFDNFQYPSGSSGPPQSYTPPDHEIVWGLGAGSRIRRDKLFWFAALDSNHRNDPGLSMVKHPYLQPPSECATLPCTSTTTSGFFAPPSDPQLELLCAQLGLTDPSLPGSVCPNPLVEALAPYSNMLEELATLLGPAPRTSAQWAGFARIDWQAAERHHFTLEGTGADLSAPGGGLTGVAANYGNHSFGSSQTSQQWLLARWEAYVTPNLLAVTQASAGLTVHSAKPDSPSALEKTFLAGNAYGQLPQIVVDNRYGFTIGNPSRFGKGSYPDEHIYRGQEMLDWVHNRLLVKAGFELDHGADAVSLLRNQTGTYTYSKVQSFISDALVFQMFGPNPSGWNSSTQQFNKHNCNPPNDGQYGALPCYSHYSQMIGPTDWNLSTNDWAGYTTAQWQAGKLAVFSAGLRWEREQMPPPLARLANPDLPQAGKMPGLGNNWGPRIGLAIGEARGHWPVLRLGYGMYYGRTENATIETALTQTGSLNGDLSYFIRPIDGYTSINGTSSAPFFPYVLQGQPASIVKPGVVEFAPNFRNPEVHQAVAAIEQPLPGHVELTASAMLSLGRRLPVFIDTNLAPATQTITYTVCDEVPTGTGNGTCGNLGLGPIKAPKITVPFYASLPASQETCPYYNPTSTSAPGWLCPDYQQIDNMESRANSTYEAAMVKLTRYGSRGLSLHAHYTYAHAMDWNQGESPLDAVNLSQEYGTSNLDVRHSAAVMVVDEAPWKLRGFAGRIANGWMLSGIGQFRSGLPYTMRVTGSLPEETQTSTGNSGNLIVGLRPGMNGSGGDNRIYGLGSDNRDYNIGRNTFRYPNTWKADLRLGKEFKLGETRQLEVLAETFNLFNHQNVTEIETTGYTIASGSPNPTLNFLTGLKINRTTGLPVPAFGQPLTINATDFFRERQIEIGVRMSF